jgi:hypothetical protein
MVFLVLILLEGFAFAVQLLVDRDDFFDHRGGVLARINPDEFDLMRQKPVDTVLGWNNDGPLTRTAANCLQQEIEYRYDAAGARTHRWFDPAQTEILTVGDSYTDGAEVTADETYPARLAAELGTSVANHGVGGYGPTQSFLNLKRHVSRYPHLKTVVLGIMYENLYRMVNSYRPVLYDNSSPYAFKPFMAAGDILPNPGPTAYTSIEELKTAANTAFDDDFWAKPAPSFPYLLALSKAVTSNYFIYRKLQKSFRRLGYPEYLLSFRDEEIRLNTTRLLNIYAEYASDMGLQPVVVFIPRNRLDIASATGYVSRHRNQFHPALIVGDVASHPNVNWIKFNLQEPDSDNICHPSPYGYRIIADYVADLLRASGSPTGD